MPLKKYVPKTPTLRYKTGYTFEEITREEPHKPLLRHKKQSAGRNNAGRIMVRRRGGGCKRHYRVVDFKRDKYGIPGEIESVEYDPNRSPRIALVKYADGERRYVIATKNMKPGMQIMSGESCEIAEGNAMQLKNIPLGTEVHNIELKKGQGGRMARSAGTYATLLAKEGAMVQLRLPSHEVRNVHEDCMATIGIPGNIEHENIVLGSAGRNRKLGRRPKVRGVAMNPVDHPMGGGEGKSSGGRHPVSPWAVKAKGAKTRKKRKYSDRYIVRKRK